MLYRYQRSAVASFIHTTPKSENNNTISRIGESLTLSALVKKKVGFCDCGSAKGWGGIGHLISKVVSLNNNSWKCGGKKNMVACYISKQVLGFGKTSRKLCIINRPGNSAELV